MRTIKFRGKRINDGEVIYSSIVDIGFKTVQFGRPTREFGNWTVRWELVDPNSVAQFTEFVDADGEEIYEGDYLEIDFAGAAKVIGDGSLIRDLETLKPSPEAKLRVEYINARYELVWRTPNGGVDTGVDLYYINAVRKFVKVIKVKEEATTDGRAEQQRLFA